MATQQCEQCADAVSESCCPLQELDELRGQLQQERKSKLEVEASNKKLRGQLKIGQDAIRAEQETSRQLQDQLDSVSISSAQVPLVRPVQPADKAGQVGQELVVGRGGSRTYRKRNCFSSRSFLSSCGKSCFYWFWVVCVRLFQQKC